MHTGFCPGARSVEPMAFTAPDLSGPLIEFCFSGILSLIKYERLAKALIN